MGSQGLSIHGLQRNRIKVIGDRLTMALISRGNQRADTARMFLTVLRQKVGVAKWINLQQRSIENENRGRSGDRV